MRHSLLGVFLAVLIPFTASAASIPLGAQRVALLTFTLSAGCGADAVIDTITVQHEGLGDTADILRLYLADATQRISPVVSFSNHAKTLDLRPRALTIPKCTVRTLNILADFSATATAGGEHTLSIVNISSTEPVTVSTGEKSVSNPVKTVPSQTGGVSVEYRDLLTSVLYGNNRTVARLFLKANAPFAQNIVSITLTNQGSARNADLQHFRLYDGNTLLAPAVSSMNGDTVRFVLSPFLSLGGSASRLLTVKADVRARAKKTIDLKVEEPSDIETVRANMR